MSEERMYVPNEVFKFRLTLKSELEGLELPVYVSTALSMEEKKDIEKAYFTQERINELKRNFIKRIEESENPFNIFCCDQDGGYEVTEEQLFDFK